MSRLVVIPWRPAPSRIEAFERVVAWYERSLPEFEIRTLDTDDDRFALARIRNLAVTILDDPDDVVVINDADTLPDPEPLRAAVDAAAHDGRVQLPYTAYHWLGPQRIDDRRCGHDGVECGLDSHGALLGGGTMAPPGRRRCCGRYLVSSRVPSTG